ncbi:hypothetical protein ACFWMS_29340, partial [Peribacillus butanolivorans]
PYLGCRREYCWWMLYAGTLQAGRYQWGPGDELSVIAAVVLGGTNCSAAPVGGISPVGSPYRLLNNGLVIAGLMSARRSSCKV